MIVGPSGSGMTQLTEALLTEGTVFEGRKTRPCHYCYAMWQPRFDRMKGRGIQCYEGIPEIDHLRNWFGKSQGGVLVQDDLMDEGGNYKRVLDLFTRPSLGMLIASSPSRIPGINRDFVPWLFKRFQMDGMTCSDFSRRVHNDLTGI